MTNWTTLTLTDLEDYLLAPQIAALRTAALADGQDDPVARTIADVVIEVRNRVAQCGTNKVSPTAGTIPPELLVHAAYIALERAQGRIPSLTLEDFQIRMANEARKILREVGKCDFKITQPSDGIETTDVISGGGASIIAGNSRPYGRDQLQHL
ncbi:MAG TPA: hypothetical protein DEA90_16265 [Opitutae bacterium]|nr:hypothetical protein [Puniceicoccaceae bacterium]HBR95712.1 hypothetical protein [Opitutae bacterium]|tara:strand:- start:904 stop:1365 length:462 start_codon:yes stop_codon:yes gene_type:complete